MRFLNIATHIKQAAQATHTQSLLKECGWLPQADRFVKPTLQKTLLLFENFKKRTKE